MQWLFKTFVLGEFTSMQNLENSNSVIIDPLGNIYDIYGNLNVMTSLLNLTSLE